MQPLWIYSDRKLNVDEYTKIERSKSIIGLIIEEKSKFVFEPFSCPPNGDKRMKQGDIR